MIKISLFMIIHQDRHAKRYKCTLTKINTSIKVFAFIDVKLELLNEPELFIYITVYVV